MTPLVRFTIFALLGVGGGYYSAQSIVADGVAGLTLTKGPWTAWSDAGTADSDPYTRAHFAQAGILPLSKFEALSFTAKTDSSGAAFRPECIYKVEGIRLPARAWTLTLLDGEGQTLPNPASRSSYNNANVVRRNDESFTITLSQGAEPGNWLPLRNVTGFTLTLDIFNVVGRARNDPSTIPVPIITRGVCR